MILGVALGVALGRSKAADLALDTPLLVLLNTPALVITVLAYVWVGLTETGRDPRGGAQQAPERRGDRAGRRPRTSIPGSTRWRGPIGFDRRTWVARRPVPQLQPYMVTAARSGLSLAWKIVLVVELLGRPDGVGFAINYYFVQSTDVAAIIGYSLVFMAVMIAIDVLLLQRLEAHVRRWR